MIDTMGKRMTFLIGFFLLGVVQISGAEQIRPQEPKYIFYKATRYYETAKYDQAIAEYTLLEKQGLESGPLYYNLGNCYFKKGNLGKAIFYYERANRIIPSDGDLRSNLDYSESLIKGDSAKGHRTWYGMIPDQFFKRVSLDTLTIFLFILYLLFFILLIARLYVKPIKKYSPLIFFILFVIFAAGALSLYEKISSIDKEAIIITEQADVKFEPFDRSTLHYTLYEGTKVRILFSKGDWLKVRDSNKRVGWVKASGIEKI